jgi:hypothetical protein
VGVDLRPRLAFQFAVLCVLSTLLGSCGAPHLTPPAAESKSSSPVEGPPLPAAAANEAMPAPPAEQPNTAAVNSASSPSITGNVTPPIDPQATNAKEGAACDSNDPQVPEVSIVALAAALQKPGLERQRFENQDEFEARAEKLLADAKQITHGKSFKFIIPVPSDQVLIDKKNNEVIVKPASLTGSLLPTIIGNGNRIIVARSTRNVDPINVDTPFSGKKTIGKEEQFVLATSARGGDYRRWPKGFQPLTIKQNLDGNRRRSKIKGQVYELGVMFTGRLQSPYILHDVMHQGPRPDFPYDITTRITTVVIELECSALIDRSTSAVLLPIKFIR